MMEVIEGKGKKLYRPMILLSVMLGMFLAAIEVTIVATAIRTIVADFLSIVGCFLLIY